MWSPDVPVISASQGLTDTFRNKEVWGGVANSHQAPNILHCVTTALPLPPVLGGDHRVTLGNQQSPVSTCRGHGEQVFGDRAGSPTEGRADEATQSQIRAPQGDLFKQSRPEGRAKISTAWLKAVPELFLFRGESRVSYISRDSLKP